MAREVRTARRLLAAVLVPAATAALSACQASTAPPSEQASAAVEMSPASPVRTNASPPEVRTATMSGNSPNGSGPGVYHYRVEYPQLADATGAVAGVDAAMRGTMQRDVDAFVDAAHDAAAAPRPGDLTCGSRAARVTARLAALRVDCTEYQAGATQPQAFTRTFNCDLDAGRVLALQDLFSPGAGYLMILSGAAREQLPGRVAGIDERTLADGTAPVADNFRAFLLEEKALVIVFPRYGSGTPGSRPEVSVPYGVLDRYLASRARNLVG